MKIKTVTIDGKTYAVLDGDKPVYTHDDGRDLPFDAVGATATITRITEESKGFKTRAQTAEAAAKAFEGLDPEAARKAVETVSNLDAGKLVQAGKVDEIKAAAIAATEEKYKGLKIENESLKGDKTKLQGEFDGLVRSNAFRGSKYITDKVAVPVHMLERTFGDRFKVEDGKLVPYDANGNKLFSRVRPGEVADFDEAVELTIASDPYKDSILKGAVGGGGASGKSGSGVGGKTISRADFNSLSPDTQMAKAREGVQVVD